MLHHFFLISAFHTVLWENKQNKNVLYKKYFLTRNNMELNILSINLNLFSASVL